MLLPPRHTFQKVVSIEIYNLREGTFSGERRKAAQEFQRCLVKGLCGFGIRGRDYMSSKSSLANSALSEMKANRASAFVPIRRSTESAVPSRSSAKSTTRSSERLVGSMVVSFNCAGII